MENVEIPTIVVGEDARRGVLGGMRAAARVVGTTMGPNGKTVIVKKSDGKPILTKDGVTVCKSVALKHPVEMIGAQLLMDAASKTNELAGDGTTTATVLAHDMCEKAMKYIVSNVSVNELRRGIEHATNKLSEELESISVAADCGNVLSLVATISANGEESIGKIVEQAFASVGKNGIVTVEDAKSAVTSLELLDGVRFDRGFMSPYFITHQDKMVSLLEDANVLIVDGKLTSAADIVPAMQISIAAKRSLLIIASDVEAEALQTLIINKTRGVANVCAVRAPNDKTFLEDLATVFGACLFSQSAGMNLKSVTNEQLGKAKKVVVDSKTCTMVSSGATNQATQKLLKEISDILQDPTLSQEEKEKFQKRTTVLSSKVALIKVGGSTEIELIERKHRIEDAVCAARAALERGIIPGGGVSLARIASKLKSSLKPGDQHYYGSYIVYEAASAPMKRIVDNADLNGGSIVDAVPTREDDECYDAVGRKWVKWIDAGIIDPLKVTLTALEHASSVAAAFVTLDAVVITDDLSPWRYCRSKRCFKLYCTSLQKE